jgi:hypothetical protein
MRIDKQSVRIAGRPSYIFWHYGSDGKSIVENRQINEPLQARQDMLITINPPVYSTVYNVARWSAVLRFVKEKHSAAWQSLIASLHDFPTGRDVETPIIYGQ